MMPAPPTPEIHVAGLFVQAFPDRVDAVAGAVAELPGAAVMARDGAGKLVVVCECASGEEAVDLIGRIRELPGVLNVALVYQHAESAEAMEKEMGHEADPPGIHQA